jgi:crossover junction endodeoxyribonuclease RuvC
MRILGVDPGIALVGFASLDVPASGRPVIFDAPGVGAYGVIETPKTKTTPERLAIIEEDFIAILEAVNPDVMSIEKFIPNPRLAFNAPGILQARGVVLLLAQKAGVRIAEYEPNKVKLTVAGHGSATKAEVREAVVEALGLQVIPRPDDAADAVGLAYCHFLHVDAGAVAV